MRVKLFATIALASAVAGQNQTTGQNQTIAQNQTIIEYLMANQQGSGQIVKILNNLGPDNEIVQALNSTDGNYTVFVPTDQAFQHASSSSINKTYGSYENVIAYHVVPEIVNTTTNVTGIPAFFGTLLTNQTVNKFEDGRGLPVGLVNTSQQQSGGSQSQPSPQNGTQTGNQVQGNEGDQVQQGQGDQSQGDQNQGTHWETNPDQITQDRFTKRQNSNSQVQVGYADGQTANIQTANIPASNGIIHYVDSVLLPPVSPVDTLGAESHLSTLYQNISGLNFNDTVDAANGITIFAPTDQALENANISQYSNDTLAKILRNHVVEGVYYTSNITNSSTLTTYDNGQLTFTNVTGTVNTNETTNQGFKLLKRMFDEDSNYQYMIDNASIVDADILTNNGVIHSIDSVLIPADVAQNNGSNNNSTGGSNNSTESGGSSSDGTTTSLSMTAIFVAASISTLLI